MTIPIRLSEAEETRLEELAVRTGRTKSFYVRTALRQYLEEIEDAYAADVAIKDFEKGNRMAVPLSQLVSELGLSEEDIAQRRTDGCG